MALVSGVAFGAAMASGFAAASACSLQFRAYMVSQAQEAREARRMRKAELKKKAAEEAAASGSTSPRSRGGDVSPTSVRRRRSLAEAVDDLAGVQGFSMEEARQRADEAHEETLLKTPREVLAELQRGNARFWMNTAGRREQSAFDRRALISKQFPTVALLSCSDSRAPPELIFDQGLGSMFVVRVAGNVLATSTMASLQYAVHHLKVKVLVVLGHELCGAVKAAQLPGKLLKRGPAALSEVMLDLKELLDQQRFKSLDDDRAIDREAVTTNVSKQVEALTRDEGIMAKVASRELLMVGGFYEISSGIVDWITEVSAPEK